MDFTLVGSDPRFRYLKARLEADGHRLVPENGRVVAPPSQRTGLAYYDDEVYVIENAALTAEAAAELVMRRSPGSVTGMDALVVGYGRIGRLLADRLAALGARVTVAARGEAARAEARVRGYEAAALDRLRHTYDVVVNTVPAPVLTGDFGGALCIDLASAPGGWEPGAAVLRAPGLPGLYAPRAAADIMAEAIYRAAKKEEEKHG